MKAWCCCLKSYSRDSDRQPGGRSTAPAMPDCLLCAPTLCLPLFCLHVPSNGRNGPHASKPKVTSSMDLSRSLPRTTAVTHHSWSTPVLSCAVVYGLVINPLPNCHLLGASDLEPEDLSVHSDTSWIKLWL